MQIAKADAITLLKDMGIQEIEPHATDPDFELLNAITDDQVFAATSPCSIQYLLSSVPDRILLGELTPPNTQPELNMLKNLFAALRKPGGTIRVI